MTASGRRREEQKRGEVDGSVERKGLRQQTGETLISQDRPRPGSAAVHAIACHLHIMNSAFS